jgi:anti-sigma regulatory factor (Ser/Thr protein kinase)
MTGDLQARATHAFLAEAEDVGYARVFTRHVLADVARDDPGHVHDVELVVSELLTNAVRHAVGNRTTWVDLHLWPRWTIVKVRDSDPAVHHTHTAPDDDGDPPESGRGLFIVEMYAARFDWQLGQTSKAAVAAILRSGVTLTSTDDVRMIEKAMANDEEMGE